MRIAWPLFSMTMKYIYSFATDRERLYDLVEDPKERTSITSSSSDKIQIARNILREHEKTVERLRAHYGITSQEKAKFDKEKVERLKALGYLQ